MKLKKTLILLCLSVLALSGCKKKETEESAVSPVPTQETTPTPEATPASELLSGEIIENTAPEGYVSSYLTGEYVPEEQGRRRPVAVMLNNIKAAVPQTGISRAGVIYEAPVEGFITRLMGIFEQYDDLDKIGSVRSCRDYYIFYATGFDAIYTHFGQSEFAIPYLNSGNVDAINGISGAGSNAFYRSKDRKAPHNAYTSYEGIQTAINQLNYSQEYDANYSGAWKFASVGDEVTLDGGTAATIIKPGYPTNNPSFEYDPQTKLYKRFQYGGAHIDDMTDEQLTVKNIIFQYSDWKKYPSDLGCLNIDVNTPGGGKYFTNGKCIDITWKKDSEWGATHYYDNSGNEITLNTGKTWVCIILDDHVDDIVIE